jgi:glycosyltransferase involved in cell wall biosynthesis
LLPDLSVIIPTYKRKDSLCRVIAALQNQQNIKLEIIVIDQNVESFFDANELEILKKVEHKKQKNANVAKARNYGFSLIKAPYVLFIDDDLVPDVHFCKNGLDVFKENNIKAFAPFVYGYEDKNELLNQYQQNYRGTLPNNNKIYKLTETLSACLFFEKSYFYNTGGFDDILFDFAKSTEDQELFKRMEIREMDFWHVPNLEIFHDDKTTGGCDLRSEDYWTSRFKFMKGWVYRYIMHNNPPGKLTLKSYYKLYRSACINRDAFKNGMQYSLKQYTLLRKAIKETKKNINIQAKYHNAKEVSFL